MFKTVVLGVGYGMEAETLAGRLGISTIESRALLSRSTARPTHNSAGEART